MVGFGMMVENIGWTMESNMAALSKWCQDELALDFFYETISFSGTLEAWIPLLCACPIEQYSPEI